jgi:DNA-binding CsgD family transcriptional regulator
MEEVRDPRLRATLLAACVEILIESGDIPYARTSADELARMPGVVETPFLSAMSAHATGAVHLAEGDAKAALSRLREAEDLWRRLDAPYEGARTVVLIAITCIAFGDRDTGQLTLDSARTVFRQLGAAPDLERLERLAAGAAPRPAPLPGLTSREVQVLRLIASGKTNRAIATALIISEKTVARHVSNIFNKLDLSSRAAATAYAFEHHLVGSDRDGAAYGELPTRPRRSG